MGCLLQVARKAWVGNACTNEALTAFLQTLHSLFVLLHGRITPLLDQVSVNVYTYNAYAEHGP